VKNKHKVIPVDSLLQLRQRLDRLPPKSPERATQVAAVAGLYGVSTTTIYIEHYTLSENRMPHIVPTTASRGYYRKPNWSATVS